MSTLIIRTFKCKNSCLRFYIYFDDFVNNHHFEDFHALFATVISNIFGIRFITNNNVLTSYFFKK